MSELRDTQLYMYVCIQPEAAVNKMVTYVSIVGHGLSSRLDELGHWVVWVMLPELLPLSLLLQGLPGSLSLDQGHPTHRKHENEFDVSLRNTKCKDYPPIIVPIEA